LIEKANKEADKLESMLILEKVDDPIKAIDDFISKYVKEED
jgi:hypothetical protein